MARSLVIGASGQIGEHLVRALGGDGVGTYFDNAVAGLVHLDARDEAAVGALFREVGPDVVHVPASEPNVDLCEREPEATAAVNVGVVEAVSAVAAAAGCRLVFYSTDYVFQGERGNYREGDAPHPLSEYGRQKLRAEEIVAGVPGSLVVRTAVVYSWERQQKNFVVRLRKSLLDGEGWRVPHDQIGNPTYAPNLAQAVLELVDRGCDGVWHVAGPASVSRYEFALAVADAFALDSTLITPVATLDLTQVARRPLNASLSVAKAAAVLSTPLLSYREGLRAMASEPVPES